MRESNVELVARQAYRRINQHSGHRFKNANNCIHCGCEQIFVIREFQDGQRTHRAYSCQMCFTIFFDRMIPIETSLECAIFFKQKFEQMGTKTNIQAAS